MDRQACSAEGGRPGGAREDGPVYSTGCLVVVLGVVSFVVLVIPALLWTVAILFSQ